MHKVSQLDALAKALGLPRLPLDIVEALDIPAPAKAVPEPVRSVRPQRSLRPPANNPSTDRLASMLAWQFRSDRRPLEHHAGATLEERLKAAVAVLAHQETFGSGSALAHQAAQLLDAALREMTVGALQGWLASLDSAERSLVLNHVLHNANTSRTA